ncbi:MAG: FAD-dependent protein [Ferruginibacter sp.]
MQQKISLRLLASEASDEAVIKTYIASATGKKSAAVSGYQVLKKSLDARGKNIFFNLSVNAFIDEPFKIAIRSTIAFNPVKKTAPRVIIIGAGPTGLFAALKLLEAGIQPVILERGKDIRSRRRDLALLNKQGILNTESNYCFGEGGAGTYSDGKLYTRSTKRGDIDRILNLFVQFGAPENILYDAHPHIGTNKLPQIITAMRQLITDCGGTFLFEKKVTDLSLEKDQIKSVVTADGDFFSGEAYIIATGHSARDIFELFHKKNIFIEAKSFSLGVRIEHPQTLIDNIQYHCTGKRSDYLPPASYSLVQQVSGRGVFSFCMCPGGIIAPASTANGELVVNGWSPSKRNNPFANSGMVVQVEVGDALKSLKGLRSLKGSGILESLESINENDPLLLMKFQQKIEQQAYDAGGGKFVAPAQRMQDFIDKKISTSLPGNSYLPGLCSSDLSQVLPPFIYESLAEGFIAFGKKLKGFLTNEAVVVATESRTSSPVRIPRQIESLVHPQINNLYPCGEGAGYAGGIVSAAMDGERVAHIIVEKIKGSK